MAAKNSTATLGAFSQFTTHAVDSVKRKPGTALLTLVVAFVLVAIGIYEIYYFKTRDERLSQKINEALALSTPEETTKRFERLAKEYEGEDGGAVVLYNHYQFLIAQEKPDFAKIDELLKRFGQEYSAHPLYTLLIMKTKADEAVVANRDFDKLYDQQKKAKDEEERKKEEAKKKESDGSSDAPSGN